MEKIIIIGSGGHALSCLDVINSSGQYNCVGYMDLQQNQDLKWKSLPYLGNDDDYAKVSASYPLFCLAVGQIESSNARENIAAKVLSAGGSFPVIVAKTAHVSSTATLAEGTVVMHGVHVGPHATIGRFNILNTKSLIEHGVTTGDFCHVSTAAVVNGDVIIGERSFVGSNAVLRQSLNLPAASFVQAGQFFSAAPRGTV